MLGKRLQTKDRPGRTPTIADVAARAGVSVATASRTLSKARPVNPGLQARVVAAARELAFSPNPHARALARSSDPTVGVIVHDLSDPYFAEIVRGMLEVASVTERLVQVCTTYHDPRRELAYLAHFRAQRLRGLVLAGSGHEDREFGLALADQIAGFEAAGGRAALIGRHGAPGDSVIADNFGGARAMVRELFALGHRRVGVISGPSQLTTASDRLAGVRRGMEECGLGSGEWPVVASEFTRDGGEAAIADLLGRAPDLTAIFALSDIMAVGALAGLRGRGRTVPGDVSLAGFDDIPIVRDLTPPLSTVRMPMAEMGAAAMRLAVEPRVSGFRVVRLGADLVMRGSTAPAPGHDPRRLRR